MSSVYNAYFDLNNNFTLYLFNIKHFMSIDATPRRYVVLRARIGAMNRQLVAGLQLLDTVLAPYHGQWT